MSIHHYEPEGRGNPIFARDCFVAPLLAIAQIGRLPTSSIYRFPQDLSKADFLDKDIFRKTYRLE
jgi:DNA-binding IclR family transcriptional regulator